MALIIAAIVHAPKSKAEVYNFPAGTDFTTIQAALSDPNNEVYLGEGEFTVPYLPRGNSFHVRAQIFQGAGIDKTILKNSAPLEPGALIMRVYGSNIDISDFTLTQAGTGFIVKAEDVGELLKYHGINITRVKFEGLHNYSGIWENSPHDNPVTGPSVNISRSILYNSVGFARSRVGYPYTNRSPFIGIDHFTGNNVLGDYLIDAFVVNSEVVGSDFLTNIVIIDSHCIVVEDLLEYMDSPTNLGQLNVTYPYTGGENCFVAEPNEFLPGTDIPKRDSRFNLGNGNYIGAIQPYHELSGNLNFDEIVDFTDFAVAANRYTGVLQEIANVAADWLSEEPNDPNGNPK